MRVMKVFLSTQHIPPKYQSNLPSKVAPSDFRDTKKKRVFVEASEL